MIKLSKPFFLSIDLDYWNHSREAIYIREVTRLLQIAKKHKIPITAVTNHQAMLTHVDASPATCLVNIDTHSDICAKTVQRFDCGSWISYVQWRRQGRYVWIHNNLQLIDVHECSRYRGKSVFNKIGEQTRHSDWGSLEIAFNAKGKSIFTIVSEDKIVKYCDAMSFCLSPCYTATSHLKLGKAILKKYNIPVKRGVREEDSYFEERTVPCK